MTTQAPWRGPGPLPADRSTATSASAPPLRGGLGVFAALTFGLTWLAWGIALALGGDIADPTVFTFYAIGGCGPSLAAVALWVTGRRSTRAMRWDAAARWLPAAVGLGAAPAVLAALVTPVLGGPTTDLSQAAAEIAASGGLLLFLGVSLFAGPLSEELGWRGYAQPRLRRRFSPAVTSAVLGAVWAVWHVPLFLLTGTWQSTLGPVEAVGFLLAMIPLSSAYWLVSERLHGGVPGAVVMHLVGNTALTLLALTAPVAGAVYVATIVVSAVVIHLVTRPPSPRRAPVAPARRSSGVRSS